MRRLIDLETHRTVFGWVLGLLADRGLLRDKIVGVDATNLEANLACVQRGQILLGRHDAVRED
jgi:hypothetical protein